MDRIYTIFTTGGYNVKYSIDKFGSVKISVPDFSSIIPFSENKFSKELEEELKNRGWSGKAILKLEKSILNEKRWCFSIDIKSGNIVKQMF